MQPKTLPDGWTEVRFDEMAKMVSKRVDPTEAEVDVYVGLEHIEPETLRIKEHGVPSDVKGQKLRFRPGHIIFGKRRAYQRKLAVAEVDGICSAHAMVLEAKPDVVHPDFLPFWMQSDLFMDRAVQISVGGLSPTINWKTLRKQTFALPPMDRQRELVEVFRGVEDVLVCQERVLASAKQLKESVAADLFERGIPQPSSDGRRREREGWTSRPLKSILTLHNGRAYKKEEWEDSGVPVARIQNLSGGDEYYYSTLELPDHQYADEGDLLYAWSGHFGPYMWSGPKIIYHYHIWKVVPKDQTSKRFLFHLLSYLTEAMKRQDKRGGLGLFHLTKSGIEKFESEIPDAGTQVIIAGILDELDQKAVASQKHLEAIRRLKRSVLVDLLTPTGVEEHEASEML